MSKHTLSCGCIKSKGNFLLASILRNKGIEYKTEYYVDLSNTDYNVSYLSFDIYLPKYNVAIEYDGEQHFIPQSFGDTKISAELKLETTQLHDKIKNEYCIKHNIPLIRIPYTHYEDLKIEDLLLNTTTFKI